MTLAEALFSNVGNLIHTIDVYVYTHLNSFAGNPLLDRIVREEEGNQLIKGGLFLACYWYFWFRREPRQKEGRARIVVIVLATLAAVFAARVLAALLPFRSRPMYDHALPHGVFAVPIAPNMETWSAFPSDMAAYFIGLAVGLVYLSRAAGIPLLLFAAIWVCVPRMYIGLHYLSDIVAGSVLSMLTIKVAVGSRWLREHIAPQVVRFSESRPEVFYSMAFLLSMEMANTFDAVRSLMHGFSRSLRIFPHHSATAVIIITMPLLALVLGLYAIGWSRRA